MAWFLRQAHMTSAGGITTGKFVIGPVRAFNAGVHWRMPSDRTHTRGVLAAMTSTRRDAASIGSVLIII